MSNPAEQKRVNFSDLSDAGRLEWSKWTEQVYVEYTKDLVHWVMTHTIFSGDARPKSRPIEEEILDFLEWVGNQEERWRELLTPEAHARLFTSRNSEVERAPYKSRVAGSNPAATIFGQPDTERSDETCATPQTACAKIATSQASEDSSLRSDADGSNPRQAAEITKEQMDASYSLLLSYIDPNAEAKAAFQRGERIEYWEETGQRWIEAITPNWSRELQWRVAPKY